MSKFLEILQDVLTVTVMLLFYIVKYCKCIDRGIELRCENSILRRYLMQNYKDTPYIVFDDDIYII